MHGGVASTRHGQPNYKGVAEMDKLLLAIIVGVIVVGVVAGVFGFVTGTGVSRITSDQWSSRDYVPANGDCFVPPRGDPLYDEHYAKNVNQPNCQAFKDQSWAKNIDSQTRANDWRTSQSRAGTLVLLFFGLAIVCFFVWAILR